MRFLPPFLVHEAILHLQFWYGKESYFPSDIKERRGIFAR